MGFTVQDVTDLTMQDGTDLTETDSVFDFDKQQIQIYRDKRQYRIQFKGHRECDRSPTIRPRQVDSACGLGRWTRELDSAAGLGRWTRELDSAAGLGSWTRQVDSAGGLGRWNNPNWMHFKRL